MLSFYPINAQMSTFSQAAVTFFAAKRICLTPRAACAKILDVVIVTEGYRSGHNEAVLKTVCRQRRVSSNLTPSAIMEKVVPKYDLFRSGDGRLIRTLLHCGSNGYGRMQRDCGERAKPERRNPAAAIVRQRRFGRVLSRAAPPRYGNREFFSGARSSCRQKEVCHQGCRRI